MAAPRRAFLDANVLRGQLTTDVLLSVAASKLYSPRWSAEVLEEVRRNRPPGLPPERTESRFAQMAKAFPKAMVTDYEHLMPEMQADEKDKHVLAAAVSSRSDVLVTENVKDFDPPTTGSNAMPIERTSEFLGRLLSEEPQLVVASLEKMVARNRLAPRTMPELIDKMATQQELQAFAVELNNILPPQKRGTHPNLQALQAATTALDGLPSPTEAVANKPVEAPEVRKNVEGPEKSQDKEL
ncbi:PIN domain-containing protein [Kribbella sp. CA-294648]|uniref:PIN domain-containing protein n=1 Tax=Kribbella sp. CA-294648 TaxID=3239948 RepID=UPI003D8C4C13